MTPCETFTNLPTSVNYFNTSCAMPNLSLYPLLQQMLRQPGRTYSFNIPKTQVFMASDTSPVRPNTKLAGKQYVIVFVNDDAIKWKRVTGPSCTKASGAELWCFLWSVPWINDWVNNREAGDLRRHRAHYDVIVMHFHIYMKIDITSLNCLGG